MNSIVVTNVCDRCHRSCCRGSGPVALDFWISSDRPSDPLQSSWYHPVDLAPCRGRPYLDLVGLLEVLPLSFQNLESHVVAVHRAHVIGVVRHNSVCTHRHLLQRRRHLHLRLRLRLRLCDGLLRQPHNGVHLVEDGDPRQVAEGDGLVGPLRRYPSWVVAPLVAAVEAVCDHREVAVGHIRLEVVDQPQVVPGPAAHIFGRHSARFVVVALSQSILRWVLRQQYRPLELEEVLASGLAHSDDQVRGSLQSAEYLLRAWAWGSLGSRDGLWRR
jgi:hypothetical protein